MKIYKLFPVRRYAPPMEHRRARRADGSLFLCLLILLFSFSLPAHAFDPCDQGTKYTPIADRYKKGLFFIIKKCHVTPSYILGTLHSDDPKIIEMLGTAFSKVSYANSANFEIKFNPEVVQTTMHAMYLEPDSIETLQSIVGIGEYNKFVNLMKRVRPNNPETTYYRMRPWAAAVMLSEPQDSNDGVALDMRLQKFAESRGIAVFGLETAESQLDIFNKLTKAQQIGLFSDAVNNYPQIEKDVKEMFDTYFSQDLTKIKSLADKSFETYSDKELAAHLKLEMIDKRNRNMTETMSEKIDLGGAFIAIGALHLPGKEGVLRQLEDRGYYIETVSDSVQ